MKESCVQDEHDSFLDSSAESNEYKDSFVESDLHNGAPKEYFPSCYTKRLGLTDHEAQSSRNSAQSARSFRKKHSVETVKRIKIVLNSNLRP